MHFFSATSPLQFIFFSPSDILFHNPICFPHYCQQFLPKALMSSYSLVIVIGIIFGLLYIYMLLLANLNQWIWNWHCHDDISNKMRPIIGKLEAWWSFSIIWQPLISSMLMFLNLVERKELKYLVNLGGKMAHIHWPCIWQYSL